MTFTDKLILLFVLKISLCAYITFSEFYSVLIVYAIKKNGLKYLLYHCISSPVQIQLMFICIKHFSFKNFSRSNELQNLGVDERKAC